MDEKMFRYISKLIYEIRLCFMIFKLLQSITTEAIGFSSRTSYFFSHTPDTQLLKFTLLMFSSVILLVFATYIGLTNFVKSHRVRINACGFVVYFFLQACHKFLLLLFSFMASLNQRYNKKLKICVCVCEFCLDRSGISTFQYGCTYNERDDLSKKQISTKWQHNDFNDRIIWYLPFISVYHQNMLTGRFTEKITKHL